MLLDICTSETLKSSFSILQSKTHFHIEVLQLQHLIFRERALNNNFVVEEVLFRYAFRDFYQLLSNPDMKDHLIYPL
ncbi:hypothetical protein D3C77_560690 [compost metagenome]